MNKDEILGSLGKRHPSTEHVMKYFAYGHLSPALQDISRDCCHLAIGMCQRIPDGPELTAGLRKLLEAKDCLVRAKLDDLQ